MNNNLKNKQIKTRSSHHIYATMITQNIKKENSKNDKNNIYDGKNVKIRTPDTYLNKGNKKY